MTGSGWILKWQAMMSSIADAMREQIIDGIKVTLRDISYPLVTSR
jgi:hypothetical protein